MSDKLPQLTMHRRTLADLPSNSLPDGYFLYHYSDEQDAAAWNKIIEESFHWQSDFHKAMESDEAFRPERVWFVRYGNIPVATASAWYIPQRGETAGYLHMVGLLPQYAGKGLGLQVSLAALHQMKREGRQSAALQTDDFRLPAIKTYLKLGFVPEFTHESHAERWKAILIQLGK
jgi:mycothiol synthase